MASVVFLRGVNVGGHKAFRPSEVARGLTKLAVKSIGAAGTFVVLADAEDDTIRREFRKQIPFETVLMICPAKQIADLVRANPFAGKAVPAADAQFITVVDRFPRKLPALPLHVPKGAEWQVGVIAIQKPFVATLMRRIGKRLLYPNEVVERELGVSATTRGWPTILKIHEALC